MPVVAAEIPTTKADCEQAGMKWKEWASNEKCRFPVGRGSRVLDPVRKVLGLIGLGSALLCLIILYREWHT